MKAGNISRKRIVEASGLLAPEWMGARFGSLKIVSREVEGASFSLRVMVQCGRCKRGHMARFHNMRKRPNTAACPHCNGREPVTVPHWLYQRCQAQQSRCQNKSDAQYHLYGGRGIEFRFDGPNAAARWIADDLGIADRSMQLDRINNNGHYEPGNLRWAAPVLNVNNSRHVANGARHRFQMFRADHPEVRYADKTLSRMIRAGLSDAEILARWQAPSCKPKGKYGTFSMSGPFKDSPRTDD